jgi:hypothetical protein
VLWLLMRNMNGRMRRMAYKEQQRVADLEAREAEREAAERPERPQDEPVVEPVVEPEPEPAQDADRADPAP